ncbi:MAG: hypothetical protein C0629_16795 [Chromatiales bacterium]|jgi:hypothetical protein|nr:MAG: hypothetical protein C0629_16795 [Chromatiales bacterium]
MAIITPDINRQLIEATKLPPLPRRRKRSLEDQPPVELKDTDAQTLVAGSGLIVAAENVPAQTRADLINCTLFAQLAATGDVPDSKKIMPWYDAYFRRLRILGWAQSDYQFQDYKFKGKHAEAHKAVEKVLAALLGPQAAAIVVIQTTLQALQEMDENSPWLTLFDKQSKVETAARFQVATAQVGPGGLLQTALVAFHLKARAKFTQVLFFKFSSSSTSLKYASGIATIQESALNETRELIADQLARYRRQMVADVKFPPLRVATTQAVRITRGRAATRSGARAFKPRDVLTTL